MFSYQVLYFSIFTSNSKVQNEQGILLFVYQKLAWES